MTKAAKTVLAGNILLLALISIVVAQAQRPPETDGTGAAYLRVNINPTEVPPMVNINPDQRVPRVEVTQLPEIRVTPAGCGNRRNFQTGVGRSIAGPLMITYLHLPPQTTASLADAGGSHSVNLASADHIATAIFLQSNQKLEFDGEIMYSGCRPD